MTTSCPQCRGSDLQPLTGSALLRCRDCRWLVRLVGGKAQAAFPVPSRRAPKRRRQAVRMQQVMQILDDLQDK